MSTNVFKSKVSFVYHNARYRIRVNKKLDTLYAIQLTTFSSLPSKKPFFRLIEQRWKNLSFFRKHLYYYHSIQQSYKMSKFHSNLESVTSRITYDTKTITCYRRTVSSSTPKNPQMTSVRLFQELPFLRTHNSVRNDHVIIRWQLPFTFHIYSRTLKHTQFIRIHD